LWVYRVKPTKQKKINNHGGDKKKQTRGGGGGVNYSAVTTDGKKIGKLWFRIAVPGGNPYSWKIKGKKT